MNDSFAFQFQTFSVKQKQCAMKIGIDSVLLGAWCPIQGATRILDLGAGSGLLSLMMAQRSAATIEAIEIEENAFHQACENIEDSIYKKQIKIIHGAVQSFEPEEKYDLIISNPPYFENSLLSKDTKRNTARHQTTLNLDAFFKHCDRLLTIDGKLGFILPFSFLDKVTTLAKQYHFHPAVITEITGREGKQPNRLLFYLQKKETHCLQEKMTIYNKEGKYTPEFKELTEQFYLPSIFR